MNGAACAALQLSRAFHVVKMLVGEQQVGEFRALGQLAAYPVSHAHGGIHSHIAIITLDEVAIAPYGTTGVDLYCSAHARIIYAI